MTPTRLPRAARRGVLYALSCFIDRILAGALICGVPMVRYRAATHRRRRILADARRRVAIT